MDHKKYKRPQGVTAAYEETCLQKAKNKAEDKKYYLIKAFSLKASIMKTLLVQFS